ncbi:efflux RND transporter periplasmic adaptor subunit [Patescibacteria group bacterium]|nr:efflux RND transporter periplasmic adaptor subunit [Patescibacteria group bacterium]
MPKPKKEKFYKRKSFKYLLGLALIVGAISAYIYFSQTEFEKYEYFVAERTDLTQEISVTGQVKAIESVDLTFETSGRVSDIYAEVGDSVKKGDQLLSLNNSDTYAQISQARAAVTGAQATLAQYQATLESEQAELDEMRKGTRPEEITIAETNVGNAESDLKSAETNLDNAESKAEVDLAQSYSGAVSSLLQAVSTAKGALLTLSDIQAAHFSGSGSDDLKVSTAKADAIQALYNVSNAGSWATISISNLTGGVYSQVQNMISNYTYDEVDQALDDVLLALQEVNIALNAVSIKESLTSTEKTSLDTEKTSVNTQITTLSSKEQTIAVQKIVNANAISVANSAINSAKNLLASAEAQLNLLKAGYTDEQIASKEARIRQVEANMSSQNAVIAQAWAAVSQYQALLNKTILTAPIDGVITRIEAKVGEIVFPSSSTYEVQVPVISLIGEGDFEIETFIPEVDIASVKIGDIARVTLDTYGSDEFFEAYVKSIDPAETLIEGVTTYKTKFLFASSDERIRSGMTANVDVITAEKRDVIGIPQRAIIYKDGNKVVRILVLESDPENPNEETEVLNESIVITGIRGTNGYMEIIEGVNEGDKVITKINNNEE